MEYKKITEVELIEEPSENAAVLAEDDGKLRRVPFKKVGGNGGGLPSGGNPHQMLVTDADGKTVWEDKLAWKEEELVTLVDDVELDFAEDNMLYDPFTLEMTVGDIVIVTINDTECYECVVQEEALMGESITYIGDGTVIGLTHGNGEPFTLVAMSMQGRNAVMFTYKNFEKITLRIDGQKKNVSPIDEDLLPKTVPLVKTKYSIVVPEQVVEDFSENGDYFPYAYIENFLTKPISGITYLVCFDGNEYELKCSNYNLDDYLGDRSIAAGKMGNIQVGDLKFCVEASRSSSLKLYVAENEPHTISIKRVQKGIDHDALPDTIAFTCSERSSQIDCSHSGMDFFNFAQSEKAFINTRVLLRYGDYDTQYISDVTRYRSLQMNSGVQTCKFRFILPSLTAIDVFEVTVEFSLNTGETAITLEKSSLPIATTEATT